MAQEQANSPKDTPAGGSLAPDQSVEEGADTADPKEVASELIQQEDLTADSFQSENPDHQLAVLRVFRGMALRRVITTIAANAIGEILHVEHPLVAIRDWSKTHEDQLLSQDEQEELSRLQLIAQEAGFDKITNFRGVPRIVKDILRRIETLLVYGCLFELRAAFRNQFSCIPGMLKQHGFLEEPVQISIEGDGPVAKEMLELVNDPNRLRNRLVYELQRSELERRRNELLASIESSCTEIARIAKSLGSDSNGSKP